MAVNMSYCRYQNTSRALQELTELNDLEIEDLYELSEDEMRSFKSLVMEMDRLVSKFRGRFGAEPDPNICDCVNEMDLELKEYENELE